MSKHALFTDIDDTLVARGKNAALLKAAHDLHAYLATQNTALILVTGADFASVKKRIGNKEIPEPDAVIAAVGTDIWTRNVNTWHRDTGYARLMKSSGYKKPEVTLLAGRFIRESQPGFQLMFQPPLAGEPYKVSLHFMANNDDAQMLAQQAREFFAPFKIIVCQEIHFNAMLPEDTGTFKFCLDIVPASKADAVSYLITKLGISDGFKAGDSGNDVDMLLNPDPLIPILVGGYKPEANAAIQQELANTDGPICTLKDGRSMYIETGELRAAKSLLHALHLFGGAVYREVALEGGEQLVD